MQQTLIQSLHKPKTTLILSPNHISRNSHLVSSVKIQDTSIEGVSILHRSPLTDSRGFFERMFCHNELLSIMHSRSINQVNRTVTVKRGTLRGLHFQHPPYSELKLVSCLRGEVYDVAVDLRRDSPTFLKWHAEILSCKNNLSVIIPEGFAHGFQTLTEDCEMIYFHTAEFHAAAEGGVNSLDPRLAIKWPEVVTDRSSRDAAIAFLENDFEGAKA